MSDLSKRLHERHVAVTHKADRDDLTARKMCKECAPWASWPCDVQLALAEIEALEARVADLERDRERLDWLEKKAVDGDHMFPIHPWIVGCVTLPKAFDAELTERPGRITIRAAIDAARTAALEEK